MCLTSHTGCADRLTSSFPVPVLATGSRIAETMSAVKESGAGFLAFYTGEESAHEVGSHTSPQMPSFDCRHYLVV